MTSARRGAKAGRGQSRVAADQRRRLFAAAFIANHGNGVQAARAAGYTGNPATLATQASRMLSSPKVQDLIREKVSAVEAGMKSEEILLRLTRLARLMDQDEKERADVFDFITLTGVGDIELGPNATLEDAMKAVREGGPQNQGFFVDLAKAKAAGLGKLVKEIAHDAETGAPRVKFHDNRAVVWRISKDALSELALIRGLKRDQPTPPPRPNLTADQALRAMPIEVLEAFNEAYEDALAKAKAIDVRAKRIGGPT